jgi:hypothetical protein
MSDEEARLVEAAGLIQFDLCLEENSAQPSTSAREIEAMLVEPVAPDWTYGLWNADFVGESNPYAQPAPEVEQSDPDDVSADAWDRCLPPAGVMLTPITIEILDDTISALVDGTLTARSQAKGDPRWSDAVENWQSCVRALGYEIDPEYERGVNVIGLGADESHQAAVADAKCADSLGTVQTMANVDAQYQAAYIRENQAELKEIGRLAQKRVEAARDILIANGFLKEG